MTAETTALIDAAFEMAAATKKPYPQECTPEFFALTDVAHRLDCACIAYKKSLGAPPAAVSERGEDTARQLALEADHKRMEWLASRKRVDYSHSYWRCDDTRTLRQAIDDCMAWTERAAARAPRSQQTEGGKP